MLQPDTQETDEEWFDDVEHNLRAFKQKMHNWMKDAEAERKAAVSSRLSDVSTGKRTSSVRSISKYSSRSSSKQSTNSSHKSSRENRALEEKIKIAELIAEAEFMEKRQTLEQQAQRLEIASEVAKSKACMKLLENTREFNEKLDTAATFTVYPAKSKTSMCQGDNPKRSGNDDRKEVIYNEIYQEYETKPHQLIGEKIADADVKCVRKAERSVDRDANMGLERNRNLRDTTSSTREPSDILYKLLQQQAAPEVDIEYFDGNPLNYHYFMALFSEVVETKIDDPRGRLTRLIKYTMGEPKELIKHYIQLPHDHGYQTAVTLLEKTYGNPHKILSSYQREVKEWPQIKFGDVKAFRKFYNFLLKGESISGSQQWNPMDTPEMLCMLIAKLPGGLIDRWNRNVQAIRKRPLRKPDLQDLAKCYTKADQKTVEQTVTVASIKCRPWHDVWAIAHAHAVTHANQEKGGLGGR